jgi:hypothetical protein
MAESNSTGRPRRRSSSTAARPRGAAPAHPAIQWIQRNPKTALAIALGIGLAVGLSPRARNGLVSVMRKAGELMDESA